MDIRLLLWPLFVLIFLVPAIVAIVVLPNWLGSTPARRNWYRLFGSLVGMGACFPVARWGENHPYGLVDKYQFFAYMVALTIGVICGVFLIHFITKLIRLRSRG